MSSSIELCMLSIVHWLHLLGTVMWLGGLATNILVLLPAAGKVLDPPMAGKLMGAVMKRFRPFIYSSMILLLISGVIMSIFGKSHAGVGQSGDLWIIISAIKHGIILVFIIMAVYSLEGLAPKVAKLASGGPSTDLDRLKSLQMKLAFSGLFLGIVILMLSGILAAISASS